MDRYEAADKRVIASYSLKPNSSWELRPSLFCQMLSTSQLSQAAPAVVAVLVVCVWLVRHLHKPPYPPGPKPAPFFGHIFQVPKTHTWRYFASLAKSYGSVVRLTLAGDDILVLNSSKDAEELVSGYDSVLRYRAELTELISWADDLPTIRLVSKSFMPESIFQVENDLSWHHTVKK